ncbi:MAG TPA: tyrosine-type recombinase/integrase [Terriglobia bacterium]|nr:tyrosine-type recombinase/integrase [Terriglobia bacterium]
MNPLEQALNDYLSIRRSLGFRLREPETSLRNFIAFLQAEGASHITRELALRWATQPATAQPSTWAWHLGIVRRFAIWHSAVEPRTEIPPAGLLPHRYRRKPPHIYSDEEIEKLLRRTQQLFSPKGLRARTYTTIFALLVATGMRVNEALGLDRTDVDLDCGILYIRRTKFGKSRYLPVHPTTVEALKKYAAARDRIFPAPLTPAFFLSERGRRITDCMARYTFAKLSQQVGLRVSAKGHGRGPRLHDMRHRFAACTLICWYRAGLDVERELPKLATYLGHVHINDTYWYLEAVPELLQLATDRLIQREVRP